MYAYPNITPTSTAEQWRTTVLLVICGLYQNVSTGKGPPATGSQKVSEHFFSITIILNV